MHPSSNPNYPLRYGIPSEHPPHNHQHPSIQAPLAAGYPEPHDRGLYTASGQVSASSAQPLYSSPTPSSGNTSRYSSSIPGPLTSYPGAGVPAGTRSSPSQRDTLSSGSRPTCAGDEEDELEDPIPAHATEQQQIEWRRRQNTLAARKSRQRKLQHTLGLEESVRSLSDQLEVWKARALTYEALLRNHGIPISPNI